MNQPRRPPRIKPNATLAIVAPASSPSPKAVEQAVAELKASGYRIKMYRAFDEPHGYLCGIDEKRADELMQAFTDDEVDAIIAARGGYGVGRILPLLDFDVIRQHPKPVVGYSDITALHTALVQQANLVSYHAPNAIDGLVGGGKLDQLSVKIFWQAVGGYGEGYTIKATAPGVLTPGVGEGLLVGGNLAVLTSLIGTPFQPITSERILLIEDIGEPPYRVDRMLWQLQQAGCLSDVAGIVIGYFNEADPPVGSPSLSMDEVFTSYLGSLGVPAVAGFPIGHAVPNLTVPIGARVRLDSTQDALTILPFDEAA